MGSNGLWSLGATGGPVLMVTDWGLVCVVELDEVWGVGVEEAAGIDELVVTGTGAVTVIVCVAWADA